jgi:Cell division protein SepF
MTGGDVRSGHGGPRAWMLAARRAGGRRGAPAEDVPGQAAAQAAALRRGMALTVLAARRGIAELSEAASPATTSGAADATARILRAALELTRSLDEGSRPGADQDGIDRMALCSYDDARAVGDRYRHGEPLIVDMAGASDGDARRLGDFIAGLVCGLHGSIQRLGFRQLLLRPAAGEAHDDGPDTGHAPDPGVALALDEVAHVAALVAFSLDIRAGGTAERVLPHVRSLIAGLQPQSLPLDVAGVDLSHVDLCGADLSGMIWTPSTTWRDPAVAAQVREASGEIRPGVYKVGTEHPFVGGVPHALPAGEAQLSGGTARPGRDRRDPGWHAAEVLLQAQPPAL